VSGVCLQVMTPRAGAAAELELYPVQVKLLRYQLTGQRQPNANMFAGMVGSVGGLMSSKLSLLSLRPTVFRGPRNLSFAAEF